MEREFRFRYFYYEFVRNYKIILIGAIVGAILLCGYYVFNTSGETVKYGATAIIAVDDSNRTSENTSFYKEETEKASLWVSFVTSDDVVKNTFAEVNEFNSNITEEEIRESIYAESLGGSVIKINVVMDDPEIARSVCEDVLNFSSTYFKNRDYDMNVIQSTSLIGQVDIENSYGEIKIEAVEDTSLAIVEYIKWIVVGLVLGAGFIYVIKMGVFLLGDRIWYREQLEDDLDIKVISEVGTDNWEHTLKNDFTSFNSILSASNSKWKTVNFVDYTLTNEGISIVEEYAKLFILNSRKVLLVEFTDQINHNIEKVNGIDILRLNSLDSVLDNNFAECIDKISSEYDYIYCISGGTKKVDAAYISKHVDESVLMIEAGALDLREAIKIKNLYPDTNFVGAIFIK